MDDHGHGDGTAQTPLPSVTFALDSFDPLDRVDALRTFFSPTVQIDLPRDTWLSVTGRLEMWQLDEILVVDATTPEVSLLRNRRQTLADDIDHWVLRVLRTGTLNSLTGDTAYRQVAGDVVLDSMADTFVDTWTPSSWVSFVLPRDGYAHFDFVDRANGPLEGTCAQLFGDFALALVGKLRVATAGERAALAHATAAMIRACFQRPVTPDAVRPEDIARVDRARVCRAIQAHLASPRLTLNRICQLTGLSWSALYRLFEPNGGVAKYVLEKRLEAVMRDLSDAAQGHRSIASIAESRGFHNAAAFSRTFSRHFGCSPRDARKALQVGALIRKEAPDRSGGFKDLLG